MSFCREQRSVEIFYRRSYLNFSSCRNWGHRQAITREEWTGAQYLGRWCWRLIWKEMTCGLVLLGIWKMHERKEGATSDPERILTAKLRSQAAKHILRECLWFKVGNQPWKPEDSGVVIDSRINNKIYTIDKDISLILKKQSQFKIRSWITNSVSNGVTVHYSHSCLTGYKLPQRDPLSDLVYIPGSHG